MFQFINNSIPAFSSLTLDVVIYIYDKNNWKIKKYVNN